MYIKWQRTTGQKAAEPPSHIPGNALKFMLSVLSQATDTPEDRNNPVLLYNKVPLETLNNNFTLDFDSKVNPPPQKNPPMPLHTMPYHTPLYNLLMYNLIFIEQYYYRIFITWSNRFSFCSALLLFRCSTGRSSLIRSWIQLVFLLQTVRRLLCMPRITLRGSTPSLPSTQRGSSWHAQFSL